MAGVHDLFTEVKNGELDSEVDALPGRARGVGAPPGHTRERRHLARHGTIDRVGGPGGPTGRAGGHEADAWVVAVPGEAAVAEGPRPAEDVAATACARLGTDAAQLPGRALIHR